MTINIIIPFILNTGGLKVIFEYVNRLQKRHHKINLIMPLIPYLFNSYYEWLKNFIKNLIKCQQQKINWFELNTPITKVWTINDSNVPDGDFVIATAWPTAYSVYKLNERKGKKIYFIQGYEIWSGPKKKVDKTWKIAELNKMVVSSWLKNIALKFNQKADIITNGINFGQFYNTTKIYHQPRRIGLLYNTWKIKGFLDGYKAFIIARKKYPDIKLYLLGITKEGAPPSDKFYENPPIEKIREFYNNCDIFIGPSWLEGCQLPPMEAMACKCALVATNVGGVPDYCVAEKTALISEPKNPEYLAENVIKLLDNPKLLEEISIAGYEYVKQFTWDKATDKLETILKNSLNEQ